MKFELTNFNPITLASKDTYCTENILIIPRIPLLQTINVVPDISQKIVNYDNTSYDGLKQVIVEPIPTEEKTVTTNGDVVPSEGKFLSKVTVNVPPPELTGTALAANVLKGKTFYNTNPEVKVTGTIPSYTGLFLEALSAPTQVQFSANIGSWKAVSGATNYDIQIDGTSIGTVSV